MIELAPSIYYLPGKNRSRFPYCACLYLVGKDMRVLIDAGMGGGNLEPAKDRGIDLLILTHCHIDHRLTRREIPHVPVWCHELEEPFLSDKARFLEATGITRSGKAVGRLFDALDDVFDVKISHRLLDGEVIDLGGLTLVTLHTPGHTPGHLAFHVPEFELLFAADVDLTPFGPYYGHDFADIDDFIRSIDKLRRIRARTVATGHAGPYTGDVAKLFDVYEEVIYARDRKVFDHLSEPKRLEDLEGRNLIYPDYRRDDVLSTWFELVHVERHLNRLAAAGKVRQDPYSGVWRRC